MLPVAPRIKCKNGVSLSVQADEYKYCTPRTDAGPHVAVEVGFIQGANGEPLAPPEDDWKKYADGDFPSDVYGYVPVGVVESFIDSNGGRVESSS